MFNIVIDHSVGSSRLIRKAGIFPLAKCQNEKNVCSGNDETELDLANQKANFKKLVRFGCVEVTPLTRHRFLCRVEFWPKEALPGPAGSIKKPRKVELDATDVVSPQHFLELLSHSSLTPFHI